MDSQRKRGVDFRLRFAWRLFLLLIAGLIHGLIYGGDILQILAVLGFFLIPVYYARNSILIVLALLFLLQIPALLFYIFLIDPANLQQPQHWSLFGIVLPVYAQGSFFDLLKTTIWNAPLAKWTFMLESGRLSTIMGMSFLGFWLGRIVFFSRISEYKKNLQASLVILFIIALLFQIAKINIESLEVVNENWITKAIFNSYADLAFTLSGLLIFVLLYQQISIQKIINFLAPCGRISLTIYITQSIIFVPFFYGFGFGAYSFIGQTVSFFLAIGFWVLQVWLSKIWITNYYYGPFEWLWRSATYFSTEIHFKKR